MIAGLLLAVGFALGADPRRIALLAVAILMPGIVLAAVVAAFWLSRRSTDPTPALFCEGVAAELRAGATIRQAISASASSLELPQLSQVAGGESLTKAAAAAGDAFPGIARELETTITRIAETGGAAADLFDEIAVLALAQEEMRREVLVASAPARAATALFLIAPAGYLLYLWNSGGLSKVSGAPGQLALTSVGLGLFLAGLAVAGVLVWRSR